MRTPDLILDDKAVRQWVKTTGSSGTNTASADSTEMSPRNPRPRSMGEAMAKKPPIHPDRPSRSRSLPNHNLVVRRLSRWLIQFDHHHHCRCWFLLRSDGLHHGLVPQNYHTICICTKSNKKSPPAKWSFPGHTKIWQWYSKMSMAAKMRRRFCSKNCSEAVHQRKRRW